MKNLLYHALKWGMSRKKAITICLFLLILLMWEADSLWKKHRGEQYFEVVGLGNSESLRNFCNCKVSKYYFNPAQREFAADFFQMAKLIWTEQKFRYDALEDYYNGNQVPDSSDDSEESSPFSDKALLEAVENLGKHVKTEDSFMDELLRDRMAVIQDFEGKSVYSAATTAGKVFAAYSIHCLETGDYEKAVAYLKKDLVLGLAFSRGVGNVTSILPAMVGQKIIGIGLQPLCRMLDYGDPEFSLTSLKFRSEKTASLISKRGLELPEHIRAELIRILLQLKKYNFTCSEVLESEKALWSRLFEDLYHEAPVRMFLFDRQFSMSRKAADLYKEYMSEMLALEQTGRLSMKECDENRKISFFSFGPPKLSERSHLNDAMINILLTVLTGETQPDPFSADQDLIVKTKDDRILIYSRGPDRNDDGGKPGLLRPFARFPNGSDYCGAFHPSLIPHKIEGVADVRLQSAGYSAAGKGSAGISWEDRNLTAEIRIRKAREMQALGNYPEAREVWERVIDTCQADSAQVLQAAAGLKYLNGQVEPDSGPANVWSIYVPVFRVLDCDYRTDDTDETKHFHSRFDESEIKSIREAMRNFSELVFNYSRKNMRIEYTIEVIDEPVTKLSTAKSPFSETRFTYLLKYWNVQGLISNRFPYRRTDSVFAYVKFGQGNDYIPRYAAGASGDYCSTAGSPGFVNILCCGDIRKKGELELHEWLHQIDSAFQNVLHYPDALVPSPHAIRDEGKFGGDPDFRRKPDQSSLDFYRHIMSEHITSRMWHELHHHTKTEFCNHWLLLGPVMDTGEEMAELLSKTFAAGSDGYPGIPRRRYTSAENYLRLDNIFPDSENASVYCFGRVESDQDREAVLWLSFGESVTAWVNSVEVFRSTGYHNGFPDNGRAQIRLKKGLNCILLRVTNNNNWYWGCYAHIGDDHARSLAGVKWEQENTCCANYCPVVESTNSLR
ncbi:MAG: hypothetical protein PHW04_12540 [Candidatus Wallbacteria bacterium]|nr:hypothetical protein [Candidatus Wallbacteria bacterium]